MNRQCEECGGYGLDNGVDDICDCDDHLVCENCGKVMTGFDASNYQRLEVFCSLKCNQEYED